MKNLSLYLMSGVAVGTFFIGLSVGKKTATDVPEKGSEVVKNIYKNTSRSVAGQSFGGIQSNLFSSYKTQDFQARALDIEESQDELESDALLRILISEWAKKDPYAALEYANGLPNRSDLVYEGLRQMAKLEPDKALEWITQHIQNGDSRQYFLRGAFKGMAFSDPEKAVAKVQSMFSGARREELLSLTVKEWARQDVHAAFDWLEASEISPEFSNIYSEIMGHYIAQDTSQASELVSQMESGDHKLSFATQIAAKLAEKDVQHALKWLDTLDGEERKYSLLSVVDRWASGNDSDQALAYVLKNTELENHEDLLATVALKLAQNAPDKLENSFSEMEALDQKIVAQQLVSAYSKNNPEKGLEWVHALEAGGVKDEAVKTALNSYKFGSADEAFKLAGSITNRRIQKKQILQVLEQWMPVDSETAEAAFIRCPF